MNDVSLFRLYLLRGMYFLVTIGLIGTIWPQIILHPLSWPLWHGVGCSMLGAVSILAALGIRYPLAMLPVLFFELIWKIIWLSAVAWPLWSADQMDAVNLATVKDCSLAVLIPLVIPWRYVWANYAKKRGDRWR